MVGSLGRPRFDLLPGQDERWAGERSALLNVQLLFPATEPAVDR